MAGKKSSIPNIPFCLKVLKDFINAVPDSKEKRVNYKALNEKKKLALLAIKYLEKMHGKGGKVEKFEECDIPNRYIPI